MEKSVTAAIGLQPAAEVAPSMNLMDGLILDQLFQNGGGGVPVNFLEHEEAPIEPGGEQMSQIRRDGGLRGVRARRQQMAAHLHQPARAAGRHVKPAKQLLPRRLDGALQADQIFRGWILAVSIARTSNLVRIRRKFLHQPVEEEVAPCLVERLVGGQNFAGETHTRNFATLRQQIVASRHERRNGSDAFAGGRRFALVESEDLRQLHLALLRPDRSSSELSAISFFRLKADG